MGKRYKFQDHEQSEYTYQKATSQKGIHVTREYTIKEALSLL